MRIALAAVYAMRSFAIRSASCSCVWLSPYALHKKEGPVASKLALPDFSSNPLRSFSLSRLSPALKKETRLVLRKTSFPRPSLISFLVRSQFCIIFSINVPYPFVLSLINTCVTAPISFPFWIIGLPLIPWTIPPVSSNSSLSVIFITNPFA